MTSRFDPRARRRARRALLQAVYQWQLAGATVREIESQFELGEALQRADVAYFKGCLPGILLNAEELDALYSNHLDRTVKELDQVERAILRSGVYELKERAEVPYRVVINEWVNLAKDFGAEASFKYVNGILDKVARELRTVEVAASRSGSTRE